MNSQGNGDGTVTFDDISLVRALRDMWEDRDPVPAGLVDRIEFTLALEDLEFDLLALSQEMREPVAARGEDRVRTITFSSENLSVMINIDEGKDGAVRLDGWIGEGGGMDVELRLSAGSRQERSDDNGRFAFDDICPGLMQLVFHPTAGASVILPRPVVTPAIRV